MDVIIVLVLFATVILRVVFVAAFAYLILPRGIVCPHCAAPLSQVRSGWLAVLTGVEQRFCLECGWTGIVRRQRRLARPTDPLGPP